MTVSPVDIVAFERAFAIGFGKAFGKTDDLRLEHQLWLAWHALKRAGRAGHDFESWMAGVEDIGQEAEASPLDEGPSTG